MKILTFIKKIIRRIPGFRRMSSQSMVIAATWYAVALLTMTRYWHWGLVMLALPFFLIYVIDGNMMRNRAFCRVVAITAGALVLLGAAGGTVSSIGSLPANAVNGTPTAASSALETAGPAQGSAPAVVQQETPPEGTLADTSPPPGTGLEPYAASKSGSVFHLPGCSSAKTIKPENLVVFQTREEAIASGRTPCKRCKP